MSEWREKPLRDVVTLKRGMDLPAHTRRPGPYPVLSAGVTAGTHAEGPVKGPGFVIGRAANLGRPTWSHVDFWPLNTTLYAAAFHDNNPKWLYLLFQSMDLSGFDSGSVQPMLNRNYISSLKVKVPPLSEQCAIAAVLGALDDKIASSNEEAGKVDLLTRLLAQRAFVTAQKVKLREVSRVTMGSSPKGEELNEDGNGLPFYQGVKDFGRRRPAIRVWTTESIRTAVTNDILFSVRAPVGKLNFAQGSVGIGRGVAAITSTVGATRTLFQAISASSAEWEQHDSTGTVFGSITRTQLEDTFIPSLGRDGDRELDTRLEPFEQRLLALEAESRHLTKLRDTLLPALMSGKLRVKDAERAVEDVL